MLSFKQSQIPNLCKNSTILSVIILTELFALMAALLMHKNDDFLTLFGKCSLYCQWIVLLSVALLCIFREKINRASTQSISLSIVMICMFSFTATELGSQYFVLAAGAANFDSLRFISFATIALIFTLLAVRLFNIALVVEQRNQSEMASRLQALQSRIQPHFLFNSLNTISELTATEPKQAERAIDSLALIFRASLENQKRFHSLENEISLCRHYVDLECWRYEDKLSLKWNVESEHPSQYLVPKLILQPLIENAIVYGVQADGSIDVSIDIRETKKDLSIVIENIKGVVQNSRTANGVAMDNIRERLFVLYDDKQTFKIRDELNSYRVLMRFPKQMTRS